MYKIAEASSRGDRKLCQEIMDEIYSDEPSYWPHGLSVDHHDGGCWLVREASTGAPAGFVGWQERPEWDGKKNAFAKIGYYTIGIRKDYQGRGFATEAVKRIVEKKASEFDDVRAMIVKGNTPSMGLAKKLGVNVIVKNASARTVWLGEAIKDKESVCRRVRVKSARAERSGSPTENFDWFWSASVGT